MSYFPVDLDYSVKRELKRRRCSEKTIKAYLYWIHRFLDFSGKTLDKISKKNVKDFLYSLDEKNLAGNTINVAHMALRFLFEEVLDKRIWVDIKYSKTPEKIQRFLTKEEINKLLNSIENWKHRLMIELMYSAGLRVSEVVNLKVKDLIFEENYGFVRGGKGNKDRVFVLAKIVKEKLKNLIEIENLSLESFVFITNRKEKYNIRTLQQIVKKAAKKANLRNWKEVHCHTLRHSFATHLIENNYSLTDVQASLGHKSPETSLTYTHCNGKMIGIKSPLDK